MEGEIPAVRVQAWLGDKLATEDDDGLRLSRPATREAVVESTRRILATGFDGAHFDLEPLHSGDRNYLTLLDTLHGLTRATTPRSRSPRTRSTRSRRSTPSPAPSPATPSGGRRSSSARWHAASTRSR